MFLFLRPSAPVASRHIPLYQRLRAAGKPKTPAPTALMRKLILLANRFPNITLLFHADCDSWHPSDASIA